MCAARCSTAGAIVASLVVARIVDRAATGVRAEVGEVKEERAALRELIINREVIEGRVLVEIVGRQQRSGVHRAEALCGGLGVVGAVQRAQVADFKRPDLTKVPRTYYFQ